MSGVVAGLIGSVKSGAAPAPENLVENPSFTLDSLTGWQSQFFGTVVRDTSSFRTAPACLQYDSGDGNANARYQRAGVLTIGQPYSLSLWIKTINTQSFTITLNAGLTTQVFTTPTQSDTAPWTNYKIENITCTGSTNLTILVESDYFAVIDDVSVVLGSTALVL